MRQYEAVPAGLFKQETMVEKTKRLSKRFLNKRIKFTLVALILTALVFAAVKCEVFQHARQSPFGEQLPTYDDLFATKVTDDDKKVLESTRLKVQGLGNVPQAKLVFSVSTFSSRCENLWKTLYSILHGTRVPDKIYVQMPPNIKRMAQDVEMATKNRRDLDAWLKKVPFFFETM